MPATERQPGLRGIIADSPVVLPALGAIALLFAWSCSQGGYPLTHWAPGGLILLALLGIAVVSVPMRFPDLPMSVRIAVLALTAYTALSYCSILWAAVPGDALEGADRTLLYLLVFCLFALWPIRAAGVALLLCTWTLALIGLALFAILHLDSAASLGQLFISGRLAYPTGYTNASAAQWLMAFWPALLLARYERLRWPLRAVFAGGAVLLADLALLSQSRGSLYSTAVMVVLVFALLPDRLRTFAVLAPIAAGVGLSAKAILAVGERLEAGEAGTSALHSALAMTLVAAGAVAVIVALGGAIESRRRLSMLAVMRTRRVLGVLAIATLLAVLGGGLEIAGNPIARVEHGWQTFKHGYGADSTSGGRLLSGLGSNRYDFYRVALDEFLAHPLFGIGSDNFAEPYLRHGRSSETPHYPHSVELRTLSQTGLLGGLLASGGLVAALLAVASAVKSRERLTAALAAAALSGFLYWLVQGSFDWFWEFAGLGAPAFALLGMACGLARKSELDWSFRSQLRISRIPLALLGGVAALAATAVFVGPWLSKLQTQDAAKEWVTNPERAYADLSDAARLDPLDAEPYLVAGSIALRYGELHRADHEFVLALGRSNENAYATLERAAIASTEDHRAQALVLFTRALELDPRDPLTQSALNLVRRGGSVNITQLNLSILRNAEGFS